MIRNFKTLSIWSRSRELVKTIYSVSNKFPKEEKFGLVSQLNRAAVSIPSNIAEGCGRGSERDLNRFLNFAVGSSCEAETQLYLAFDLDFVDFQTVELVILEVEQIRKMIIGFQKTLKK